MFSCELCNKQFKLKTNYIVHKNKKNPCVKEEIKCLKCNRTFKCIYDFKNHLNKKNPCDNKEIYKCDICNKQYITIRNYKTHMKTHNNNVNKVNNVNHITNNNTYNITNNITNINNTYNINITINGFGKENYSYLTEQQICKILDGGYNCIPDLIKEIHFNTNYPENHNVYIANLSKKTILIYDGDRWILAPKNKIIKDIIDNNEEFITEKYDELKNKLSKFAIRRLDKFLNDEKRAADINEPLQLILYNYRDIVKNTHNKLKNKL